MTFVLTDPRVVRPALAAHHHPDDLADRPDWMPATWHSSGQRVQVELPPGRYPLARLSVATPVLFG